MVTRQHPEASLYDCQIENTATFPSLCQLYISLLLGLITYITFQNKSASYQGLAAPIACVPSLSCPCTDLAPGHRSRAVREFEWHQLQAVAMVLTYLLYISPLTSNSTVHVLAAILVSVLSSKGHISTGGFKRLNSGCLQATKKLRRNCRKVL